MEFTSAKTFVASFAFQEIDYFVMLAMTAFIGWRITEMVRHSIKKDSKSKASKLSQKSKPSEEDETVVPQLKYPADSAQPRLRIPPTQTSAARAAVPMPSGLEHAISQIRAPPGLQLPPGLPHPQAPAPKIMQEPSWRKVIPAATPVAPREDNTEKQLGRVVCWKETGYGFVVDEAGERLFVRQGEVEGGEQLRAGQLIWFRRGRVVAGQAAKAMNVTIVSQEAARVMRQSTPFKSLAESTPKVGNKALAFPKKEVFVVPPPTLVPADAAEPAEQKSSDDGNDDDLCAFLGAGSKEEQIKNLKYAPQWVAEKFWSQQAQRRRQ